RVRPARLPVGVASPPLPGGVPLRPPQRAADGLLPAREPRPGRAAPRRRGASARRQPERLPLLAGGLRWGRGFPGHGSSLSLVARRPRGPRVRLVGREGRRRSARGGTGRERAIRGRRRSRAAGAVLP